MKTNCPSCGAHLTAKDESTGRRAKCPRCQVSFVLHAETTTSSASPLRSTQEPGEPGTCSSNSVAKLRGHSGRHPNGEARNSRFRELPGNMSRPDWETT